MPATEKTTPPIPRAGSVVATLHCAADLGAAMELDQPSGIDYLEYRLDSIPNEMAAAQQLLRANKIPAILTARAATEGGQGNLGLSQRKDILLKFLPAAAMVDIELASADLHRELAPLISANNLSLILSFHDFNATPELARLLALQSEAIAAGAVLFKVATHVRDAADLYALQRLLEVAELPLAVMGMGPLGKCSRLLLATAGSRLNYGYLSTPNAAGQWPATLLATRISECLSQAD